MPDRGPQHPLHGAVQTTYVVCVEAGHSPLRRQPRLPEDLVGEQVAQSRYDRLVHQRRFQRASSALQCPPERGQIEAERIGTLACPSPRLSRRHRRPARCRAAAEVGIAQFATIQADHETLVAFLVCAVGCVVGLACRAPAPSCSAALCVTHVDVAHPPRPQLVRQLAAEPSTSATQAWSFERRCMGRDNARACLRISAHGSPCSASRFGTSRMVNRSDRMPRALSSSHSSGVAPARHGGHAPRYARDGCLRVGVAHHVDVYAVATLVFPLLDRAISGVVRRDYVGDVARELSTSRSRVRGSAARRHAVLEIRSSSGTVQGRDPAARRHRLERPPAPARSPRRTGPGRR